MSAFGPIAGMSAMSGGPAHPNTKLSLGNSISLIGGRPPATRISLRYNLDFCMPFFLFAVSLSSGGIRTISWYHISTQGRHFRY